MQPTASAHRTDGSMDGWRDGWKDGRNNGWTEGRNGWMDVFMDPTLPWGILGYARG